MPGRRIAAPEHPGLRSAQFRVASGLMSDQIEEGAAGSEPNCGERSHGCSGAAMRRPGIRGVAEALCYAGTAISVPPKCNSGSGVWGYPGIDFPTFEDFKKAAS